MPPPYTTKTRIKFNNLVMDNNEAPESWPSYPVYLRGEAETVEEAQKKLRAIMNKKQLYCYSTDNDDHAEDKSKRCTKFFEEKVKGKSEDAIDKIMYDSEIIGARNSSNESNSSITSNDQSEYIQSKSLLRKKKTPKKGTKKKINIQQDIEAIPSTSANRSNINSAVASNIIKQSFKVSLSNNLSQSSTNTKLNNTAITPPENVQHTENDEDVTFPKEILLLHKAIKSLTIEVSMQSQQIRQLRLCIENTLKIKVDAMTIEKFIEKHNITLKFSNLEALKDFNEKLSAGGEFLSDFKSSLKCLVQENMYKTLLVILKRLMDRKLAAQCTAVRLSKDKYLIKDTTLYTVLFAFICTYCAAEGKPITEKEFTKALGSIFNNAKDWDGQRNARRLTVARITNMDTEREKEKERNN